MAFALNVIRKKQLAKSYLNVTEINQHLQNYLGEGHQPRSIHSNLSGAVTEQ